MPAVTPRGFRDILPTEALARERITGIVRECFSKHGYLPVETPILEDRRLLSVGSRIEDSPVQLFDADGSLLMVRPDLTLPIARMVSSRMAADDLPLRLRYSAPVVREESSLKGQPRQFTQLGIEYYGNDDGDALPEVEVVSLLAETLEALDVPAWRIVCGSVSPLKALLAHCSPSKEFEEGVLSYAHESDLVSLDDLVDSADLSEPARLALHQVPRMSGGSEVIARIDSCCRTRAYLRRSAAHRSSNASSRLSRNSTRPAASPSTSRS